MLITAIEAELVRKKAEKERFERENKYNKGRRQRDIDATVEAKKHNAVFGRRGDPARGREQFNASEKKRLEVEKNRPATLRSAPMQRMQSYKDQEQDAERRYRGNQQELQRNMTAQRDTLKKMIADPSVHSGDKRQAYRKLSLMQDAYETKMRGFDAERRMDINSVKRREGVFARGVHKNLQRLEMKFRREGNGERSAQLAEEEMERRVGSKGNIRGILPERRVTGQHGEGTFLGARQIVDANKQAKFLEQEQFYRDEISRKARESRAKQKVGDRERAEFVGPPAPPLGPEHPNRAGSPYADDYVDPKIPVTAAQVMRTAPVNKIDAANARNKQNMARIASLAGQNPYGYEAPVQGPVVKEGRVVKSHVKGGGAATYLPPVGPISALSATPGTEREQKLLEEFASEDFGGVNEWDIPFQGEIDFMDSFWNE